MAPAHVSKARALRQSASDLLDLADRVEQPSDAIERSDRLIAEGERIAAYVRAQFRG
jgi:hypothetical protein